MKNNIFSEIMKSIEKGTRNDILVNYSIEDLKKIITNENINYAISKKKGKNCNLRAIKSAIKKSKSLKYSKGVILNIEADEKTSFSDITEMVDILDKNIHSDTKVIISADNSLKGNLAKVFLVSLF